MSRRYFVHINAASTRLGSNPVSGARDLSCGMASQLIRLFLALPQERHQISVSSLCSATWPVNCKQSPCDGPILAQQEPCQKYTQRSVFRETDLQLVPRVRFRMSGVMTSLPLHSFMTCVRTSLSHSSSPERNHVDFFFVIDVSEQLAASII